MKGSDHCPVEAVIDLSKVDMKPIEELTHRKNQMLSRTRDFLEEKREYKYDNYNFTDRNEIFDEFEEEG